MLENPLMKWNWMTLKKKLLETIINKLEYPTSWCLCHYSNFVDNLRINTLQRVKKYYEL
jgi:hypothetical protein